MNYYKLVIVALILSLIGSHTGALARQAPACREIVEITPRDLEK